jgi:hypothetical protein
MKKIEENKKKSFNEIILDEPFIMGSIYLIFYFSQ